MAATVMTSPQDNMDDDDVVVWERLARGVKAYDPELRRTRPAKSPNSKPKQALHPMAKPSPRPPLASRQASNPIDIRSGEKAGIDGATRRRLAQGQIRIEARLDLHGLTAAQAERRLARFVDQAACKSVRCVLVITGKGSEGKGVLRRLVPLWLKAPPLSGQILAISQAREVDGGGGALYVMLRRKRQAG
mgnify:FL=1